MSLGGVFGVVSRYLIGGLVGRVLGLGFPYGTFVVNVSGCALIGFLATMGNIQWYISPNLRAFLFVGFLGAYTTFSTYMFESYEMIHQGKLFLSMINLAGSVVLGFLGFCAGVIFARWV